MHRCASIRPMSGKPHVGAAVDFRGASRPRRSVLEGRHVRVRPLNAAGDAASLFAQSHPPLGDPDLWTYLPTGPYGDADEMHRALEQAERSEDPLFFTPGAAGR